MTSRLWRLFVAAAYLSLNSFMAPSARAADEVDLALVLAVDVSRSMDPEEQELQRQGFVEAFRSPLVHDAIRAGMLGRITVSYMEWSGDTQQNVVVPWTIITGPEGASEFADGSLALRSAGSGEPRSLGPSRPARGCWTRPGSSPFAE
jgi:hypothetical protein